MSTAAFSKAALGELQGARDFTRAWQRLVPPSAIANRITAFGIEYLHPTKGWRAVSHRRFALYSNA